jgi:hypothetical protein
VRWLTASIVLAYGCGAEADDATVRFDLTSLWQQSAQSVSIIWVRVFDADGSQQRAETLVDFDATADLIVVPGPSMRFEVEALTAAGDPSYWGDETRDVSAGDDIQLTIPVFPAGGVAGTVTVSGGAAIPSGSVVIATASAPRPDAPTTRELVVESDNSFAGTLPDGAYSLSIDFLAGGTPYSGTLPLTVVREQTATGLSLSAAP